MQSSSIRELDVLSQIGRQKGTVVLEIIIPLVIVIGFAVFIILTDIVIDLISHHKNISRFKDGLGLMADHWQSAHAAVIAANNYVNDGNLAVSSHNYSFAADSLQRAMDSLESAVLGMYFQDNVLPWRRNSAVIKAAVHQARSHYITAEAYAGQAIFAYADMAAIVGSSDFSWEDLIHENQVAISNIELVHSQILSAQVAVRDACVSSVARWRPFCDIIENFNLREDWPSLGQSSAAVS